MSQYDNDISLIFLYVYNVILLFIKQLTFKNVITHKKQ